MKLLITPEKDSIKEFYRDRALDLLNLDKDYLIDYLKKTNSTKQLIILKTESYIDLYHLSPESSTGYRVVSNSPRLYISNIETSLTAFAEEVYVNWTLGVLKTVYKHTKCESGLPNELARIRVKHLCGVSS